MRIVQINMLHNGSTGKIMQNIAACTRAQGHEVWTFSPIVHYLHSKMETSSIEGHCYFGYRWENMWHRIFDRILGLYGMFSVLGTKQLLKSLDVIKPDLIHLHNLHNLSIDLRSLFSYIKNKKITVIWTLHDCWAITGRCPYFDIAACDKWKTGCGACSQLKGDPLTYTDLTRLMWKLKKRWFTSVKNLIIVTPSSWLADQVKQSYLKECTVQVIHNGIDLSVFRPVDSDFRVRYECEAKKVILGVAFDWEERKGLDVFETIAQRLSADYRIVLVGTNGKVEAQLPDNVIAIRRTQNQHELAAIYSAADVFVNPTREDNFPTVNIEALACGTPVITFRTGGSPEIIDETCGSAVECNDVEALEREIIRICNDKPYCQEACVKRAQQFDQREKFKEYVKLYEDCAYRA